MMLETYALKLKSDCMFGSIKIEPEVRERVSNCLPAIVPIRDAICDPV
jgi:hypothetical protein